MTPEQFHSFLEVAIALLMAGGVVVMVGSIPKE